MAEVAPILELHALRKSFGALKATDDVTLDVRPGEIHALIGPNGAGKTTLIHQVAGSLTPDGGDIRFNGADISGLTVAQRVRLGLGRTFQVSSIAPEFSALRNVMLSVQSTQGSSFRFFKPVMRDASLVDAAMEKLSLVGLAERADVVAAELSHGQRRQLEMAMALALKPKLLLLDEPMAGMGPEGSKNLIAFLDTLRHEVPILLVEHDMEAVFSLADRISVLVYGSLIASGSVEDIRANRDVREAYLGEGD